jgi:probable O-glycosylation ligase (exosortase A-associated)
VWKALIFALFLPLTLRTRLRIEALALTMVLSVGVIVIGGGIKTLSSGGGYGELRLLVNDNTGLYEGSIISTVAMCVIPLALWLANHGTIFKPDWKAKLFAAGICFACLLMPVGTQARTGLICAVVLAVMMLRSTRRRMLYISILCAGALVAVPLLPSSFTERMGTIKNHQADQSASTRVAVWKWTIEFAKTHPFGGGFDAFRQDSVSYDTVKADYAGDNNAAIQTEHIEEKGRAYHSAYFEMLGEQGYPGLALWLLLHLMGVFQMEVIRRRYRSNPPEGFAWVSPLADALQQAQICYLVGSTSSASRSSRSATCWWGCNAGFRPTSAACVARRRPRSCNAGRCPSRCDGKPANTCRPAGISSRQRACRCAEAYHRPRHRAWQSGPSMPPPPAQCSCASASR